MRDLVQYPLRRYRIFDHYRFWCDDPGGEQCLIDGSVIEYSCLLIEAYSGQDVFVQVMIFHWGYPIFLNLWSHPPHYVMVTLVYLIDETIQYSLIPFSVLDCCKNLDVHN